MRTTTKRAPRCIERRTRRQNRPHPQPLGPEPGRRKRVPVLRSTPRCSRLSTDCRRVETQRRKPVPLALSLCAPTRVSRAEDRAEAVVSGATTLLLEEMKEYMNNKIDANTTALLVKHSFTFDVVVQKDTSVQLIEINPFGTLSGCGACLFHWVRDARLMYGLEEEVDFRVTAGPVCTKYCGWGCEVIGGCACLEQEWKTCSHVDGGGEEKAEGFREGVKGPEEEVSKSLEGEVMVGLTGFACEVMRRWKRDYLGLID